MRAGYTLTKPESRDRYIGFEYYPQSRQPDRICDPHAMPVFIGTSVIERLQC